MPSDSAATSSASRACARSMSAAAGRVMTRPYGARRRPTTETAARWAAVSQLVGLLVAGRWRVRHVRQDLRLVQQAVAAVARRRVAAAVALGPHSDRLALALERTDGDLDLGLLLLAVVALLLDVGVHLDGRARPHVGRLQHLV